MKPRFNRIIVGIVAGMLAFHNVAAADGVVHAAQSSKPEEQESFKHYVYTKFGVSITKYRKFKEISHSYLKKAPNVAPMFYLGLGRQLTPHTRAEVNLQYGRFLYKGVNNHGTSLRQTANLYGAMANAYYDILPNRLIVPYVTAGIGVGVNKASDLNEAGHKVKAKRTTNFLWNAGVGGRMKLSQRFTLDLGYRYADLGKVKVVDTNISDPSGGTLNFKGSTQSIYGHQFLGAVSYNF